MTGQQPAVIPEGTLRADIEKRRAQGDHYSLRELVAILVPLCASLIERHARGETFRVSPGDIRFVVGAPTELIPSPVTALPDHPSDKVCLPPEVRAGKGGNASSTVFSIGAIAYEMLTGQHVGPAMRRPSEMVPGIPPGIDVILSKALIADLAHRPADLGALAQALHGTAPTASQAPPWADTSALDGDGDIVVDVSLSMLPPERPGMGLRLPKPASLPKNFGISDHNLVEVSQTAQPVLQDATSELTDLKAAIEGDPRPRYLVVKDSMDHGPFSGVELLQQIASHAFESHHVLIDTFSQDQRPISEWEAFAPFAQHARMHRESVAEKQEIERVVVAESKATRSKALFIGLTLTAVIGLGVGGWLLFKPKSRTGEVAMANDKAMSIDIEGSLKGATKGTGVTGGVGRATGSDGISRPVLSGGMSCEQAMNTYATELKLAGNQPDITNGQLGRVLNDGSYVIACGAPASMTVNICAAIQNGRAVGVTVSTDPSNGQVAGCIASRVRGMGFPSHPALDVTRTVFKGE